MQFENPAPWTKASTDDDKKEVSGVRTWTNADADEPCECEGMGSCHGVER